MSDSLIIARRSGRKFALLVAALFCASLAEAQNIPHLGYAYPAGGRQGTTFQVVVGGVLVFAVGIVIGSA